jgi:hypothetical protein
LVQAQLKLAQEGPQADARVTQSIIEIRAPSLVRLFISIAALDTAAQEIAALV